MAATLKKPAPKLAGSNAKAAPKAAPKLAGKPAKAAKAAKVVKETKYADGAIVEFLGYSATKSEEDAVYEVGQRLVVISTEVNSDKVSVLNTIPEADLKAYEADPEDENVIGDQVFPSEVKKAEKLAVDPYAITITHVGRVDEILEEAGGDPLVAYNNQQASAQESFFYMGAMITELYANKSFQSYGDFEDEKDGDKVKAGSGWNKFCREMLDMEGRKAHASMQVYRQFSAIEGFDPATISSGVGWVKLQIMASSVTAENVEELVEKAKESSTDEFRETIRTEYVADRESQGTARQTSAKVKRITFTYRLFEDQGEGVKYVLETAKKELGITDDANLLERIVMEWGRDHLSEVHYGKARRASKKKLQDLKKAGHDVAELQARASDLDAALDVETAEETETAQA